jgi:hypothetical protein
MALVDLTVCSVCVLKNEDSQPIHLAEISISYPALNEGEFI